MAVLCAVVVGLIVAAYVEQVRYDRRTTGSRPRRPASPALAPRDPARVRIADRLTVVWLWAQVAAAVITELTARQPARHRRTP
jgi:hypothetical protein